MRRAFIGALVDLAEADPSIVFLTADLGFSVVEPFALRFPGRFINVGVAEQNMVGIATGLAEAGWTPFIYSIAPFVVLRPYEFIRNGPIAHRLPVRIVGVGAGVEYGHNGLSHYGLEDIGVLRIQPGITVVAPADCRQARTALFTTRNLAGPVYFRLSKEQPADVPGLEGRFDPDVVDIVQQGADVALVALGTAAAGAIQTADLLSSDGLSAAVAVVSCVHPCPRESLLRFIRRYRLVVTIEEHYVTGGLGSMVAELIAEEGCDSRLVRVGIRERPSTATGSKAYMHQQLDLSPLSIARVVLGARHASPRP